MKGIRIRIWGSSPKPSRSGPYPVRATGERVRDSFGRGLLRNAKIVLFKPGASTKGPAPLEISDLRFEKGRLAARWRVHSGAKGGLPARAFQARPLAGKLPVSPTTSTPARIIYGIHITGRRRAGARWSGRMHSFPGARGAGNGEECERGQGS